MKILYVITKSNWGGAQRHVYDLAVAMKQKGHDVAVAVGGNGTLRTKLEAEGIYTHSIDMLGRDISTKEDAASLKEIFSIIRHRRPDVLHLHSPKAAGLGSFAGRMLRVPLIINTVHGWSFNEARPLLQRAVIAFFSWLTMIFCHQTILLSDREYKQALHFPAVKERITLIPPGIKPPIFISIDGAKQEMARWIGLELTELNKKTVLGSIAELIPNKGLKYMIEAFVAVAAQYPQAVLVIIGDGQEKANLSMLIKEKNLENNVFLAGYVDHANEYLKALNIFVLSSVKEGLPYVILEAGAASLPVVATTVGGIPEVISDMHSGVLVQPKNIRELSHAMSFMIEHPDERRKYGGLLKEKVSKDYSIEMMTARVEDLYTKQIKG